MCYFNDDNNFNLFHSMSCQNPNQNDPRFISENKKTRERERDLDRDFFQKQLSSKDINNFQNEMKKYERIISEPHSNNKYFHFNFNGSLNTSYEPKEIAINKSKSSRIDNFYVFKRKINSNSLYVGFENKYGENSCYINVVLHFLYFFPCINEFLIKQYQTNKDTINFSNNNITNINNIDFFLFLLGRTLLEYQNTLSNLNNKGITILQTSELRKYLDLISNDFKYNNIADPVELLTFILNIINNNNQKEVHQYFFINLVEEVKCSEFCEKNLANKYDKDNFIYYIYVDEIMSYINKNHLYFQKFNHNLFQLSKKTSLNYCNNCEKCGSQILKKIKFNGQEYPTFLLLNCVWNNKKQELKDVTKFLYVLPLEDDLNNLFSCNNKGNHRIIYNLLGMILYSSTLSHYINVMFNIQKNLFVLYDDDKIKELESIHDVYKEITAEEIKKSKAFFYPVLLIYYKEMIYDDPYTIKINDYNIQNYNCLVEECKKAKKESNIVLTDEQKRKNYLKYIEAQMKYEQVKGFYLNDSDNLGCSSLYKVCEEIEDGKDNKSKSSDSLKMVIEEGLKDYNNNNNNINNISNNNIIINNNNNKNNYNYNINLINNNDNNNFNDNNNNMNIEMQEMNEINYTVNKDNYLDDRPFNAYKYGNDYCHSDQNHNLKTNGNLYIRRNKKSYSHQIRNKVDFFNNIL